MMNNPADRNVENVRDGIQSAIRQLQADQRDYGGHRVAAIDDLTRAEHELDLGLAFDRTREPGGERPGERSDRNVEAVIDGLNNIESQLSADQRDYGGHRVSAIDDIRQAINQLQAALQFDRTHPQG